MDLISGGLTVLGSVFGSGKAPSRNFVPSATVIANAVAPYGVPWDPFFDLKAGNVGVWYSQYDNKVLTKAQMDANVAAEVADAVAYAKAEYDRQMGGLDTPVKTIEQMGSAVTSALTGGGGGGGAVASVMKNPFVIAGLLFALLFVVITFIVKMFKR